MLVPLSPTSDLWLEQGIVKPIDISALADDDFISIALPAFPLASVSLADSYVVFTSHAEGNFAAGPSDEVSFSQSLTTLVAGDSEFRFEISELATIDRSAITGIKFIIEATGSATFRALAIRAISKDWVYSPIDTDTLYGRVAWPVSLDGDPTPTYGAPFTTWPNLFRADVPPSAADPTPVDAKLAVSFNTGNMDEDNRVSVYLREQAVDYITQLELDGTPVEELDGLPQPDSGEAEFLPRVQIDFDSVEDSIPGSGVDPGATVGEGLVQSDMNGIAQFDLERKPDPLTAIWLEVRIDWNSTDSTVGIFDAEQISPYYTFDLELDPETLYTALIDLIDRTMRVRVFTQDGNIISTDPVLDTTTIVDPGLFKRRKGRVGWQADFEDGNAYLESFRARYTNFAEYRSHPFESITPVVGASIDVGASDDDDLFRGIYAGPWGGQFYDNPDRGAESFRVRNTAIEPLQGVQTNPIYFDDFYHTEITFDIYVVKSALDVGSMTIFLWDGIQPIPLPLGKLNGDAWNHVKVNLDSFAETLLPGEYSFSIVQSVIGTPNDWLLDNISVKRTAIEWSARSYSEDVWGLHEDDWVPFKNAVNKTGGGVLFTDRTNRLQTKAVALRQDSQIGQIRVTPKYAELGRFQWDTNPEYTPPTASFTSSVSGRTVTFQTTSTGPRNIISTAWTFGDGREDTGPGVRHTYDSAGTYPVTLIVTDTAGVQDTHLDSVIVS